MMTMMPRISWDRASMIFGTFPMKLAVPQASSSVRYIDLARQRYRQIGGNL